MCRQCRNRWAGQDLHYSMDVIREYDYPFSRTPWSSPLDRYGFRTSCCWCISLRLASVLICLVTIIWAAIEFAMAEKFLGKVIENKNVLFFCKTASYLFTGGLLVAAMFLLLGIVLKKYLFVNIYVWYTLVYACLSILVYIGVVTLLLAKTKKFTVRLFVKVTVTIAWYSILFYFLIIVNSYKSNLW